MKSKHDKYIEEWENDGYTKNGIYSEIRKHGIDVKSGRLPDFWTLNESEFEWHEVVSSHDICKDKMEFLYWLKDILEGEKINGKFSGLKCFKHDLVTDRSP